MPPLDLVSGGLRPIQDFRVRFLSDSLSFCGNVSLSNVIETLLCNAITAKRKGFGGRHIAIDTFSKRNQIWPTGGMAGTEGSRIMALNGTDKETSICLPLGLGSAVALHSDAVALDDLVPSIIVVRTKGRVAAVGLYAWLPYASETWPVYHDHARIEAVRVIFLEPRTEWSSTYNVSCGPTNPKH